MYICNVVWWVVTQCSVVGVNSVTGANCFYVQGDCMERDVHQPGLNDAFQNMNGEGREVIRYD